MIRYATIEDAKTVVDRWQGHPDSIIHLGNQGNSVFSFQNSVGNLQILRFTDNDFRSFDELVAEMNFVHHLKSLGVGVAEAIPTSDGVFAFWAQCSSGNLICSSIAYAPGHDVQEGSPNWGIKVFEEWGRNLGLIHKGATTYVPRAGEPKRWSWESEILIEQAEGLIPKEDSKSREEFREVISNCKSLPKSPNDFGLIHADHTPQNFRYDPETDRITAFDFGNCCYHWYVADLAVSLSTVRRKKNRDEIRAGFLEGYSLVRDLPSNLEDLIDLFIRLRVVYVYLSRLHLWSKNRTVEQERDLAIFKSRVHSKSGWGRPDVSASES